MYRDNSYTVVLNASYRAAWRIEDVIGDDDVLDFTRPFMPKALARTDALPGLSTGERLVLNHIRAHEYLGMFGLVEEFVLPFVLDHARQQLTGDDWRIRALLQFAGEEAKHIQLFKRFHAIFEAGFGTQCPMIGPAEAIGAKILRHDPLSIALTVLQIEWTTQRHYIDSVRDDGNLDPLFKSLLKHHWMEEAQHARIDTLMVEALADGRSADDIMRAFEGYLEIGAFLDKGLAAQTQFNLGVFERVAGRTLGSADRAAFLAQQHQAARWTFLGSGMTHSKFRATLAGISPAADEALAAIVPTFL